MLERARDYVESAAMGRSNARGRDRASRAPRSSGCSWWIALTNRL